MYFRHEIASVLRKNVHLIETSYRGQNLCQCLTYIHDRVQYLSDWLVWELTERIHWCLIDLLPVQCRFGGYFQPLAYL